MRIMIIGGGFLPAKNYGGPVVSIENFVNLMKKHNHYIVTRDHDFKSTERLPGIEDGWNRYSENTQVIYLKDSEHSRKKYVSLIKEISPDLIYINGFYLAQMFIPAIAAAKFTKTHVLFAPRGTLCKNAMAIKSFKKYLYVLFMSCFIDKKRTVFHSTSEEETQRIHSLLRIKKCNIYEVANIPSTVKGRIQSPNKKKNELKCCFFARICSKKNLLFAIKALENVHSHIIFSIYGKIEDEKYWEECQKEAEKLPSNVTLLYKGSYDHSNVFDLMSSNDVFLFPTLSENYGHVIVEAMLSRLPVIISDQTPWIDVEKNNAGFAFPLNEIDRFSSAIDGYAEKDTDEFNMIRLNVDKYIEKALSIKELKEKYQFMIENSSHL